MITTPFSFVASTNVLFYERITPIFVDVDPQVGNIDPALVAEAAADFNAGGRRRARWLPERGYRADGKLKGILAVDVFGQPADYDALNTIAAESGLSVIEDSCEALGAGYKERPAGRIRLVERSHLDANQFAAVAGKQFPARGRQ